MYIHLDFISLYLFCAGCTKLSRSWKMQGAQHQVQSQGAALRKSGREAHAIDIGRLFCLSVSKLLAMWGFPVYSKRLSVRWQFCGLQKWYISVVQVQQTWYLLVSSSLLSSWLMAASIQRSTHLRKMLQGK